MSIAIFDTATRVSKWRVAKKTKNLRAKPMINLVVDKSVMSKFLVDTLEAKEPVSADSMFCIGENNDAWQQTPKKLLAKYDVIEIDADGWMVCRPKPENSVEFYETQPTDYDRVGYIVGQWGGTVSGVPNVQEFSVGDIIARNREDHTDQWIVRRKIWLNSYTEIDP